MCSVRESCVNAIPGDLNSKYEAIFFSLKRGASYDRRRPIKSRICHHLLFLQSPFSLPLK